MPRTPSDAPPAREAPRRSEMERSDGRGSVGTGRGEPVGFQTLCRRVCDTLLRRLADAAGQISPSEGRLATELGVSQGTVREALDALIADSLPVRRRGRGTFIADHADKQSVFRPSSSCGGRRRQRMPHSRVITMADASANVTGSPSSGPPASYGSSA